MHSLIDETYMQCALDLAWAQKGQTGDNPSVGCILIKDGNIIGQGVTAKGGRPHGETQALHHAGENAKGATCYVTLEPCSHYGGTPPCADVLIRAGIARCVIAVIDPNPNVNWQGAARLQEAGIDTVIGCLASEAFELYQSFFARFS